MTRVRILDLDGSLAPQADVFPSGAAEWIAAREWGLTVRLACPFAAFDRFRGWLDESLGAEASGITFYGSGDFHHVTLALLARIREPFNLLVLDKHPDWMRGIPFLHCGTWLRHALRLPCLRRVFHFGGETDFDNAYRWLAPWRDIRAGRVVVFPAKRRFARGPWSQLGVHPILSEQRPLREVLKDALQPFRKELARYPLYVSFDKDVLTADDASVNWDSGLLRLAEAIAILNAFIDAAAGRLAGADMLGDWSPVRLGHRLSRLCDLVDHPSPRVDPDDAANRNRRVNAAVLSLFIPRAAKAA
jgi:hypothetical protein